MKKFIFSIALVITLASCSILKKDAVKHVNKSKWKNPTYSTQESAFKRWSIYNFKRQTRKTW